MAEVGAFNGNNAQNGEILPSDATNNFSLASLNEIEKKLVEQSFEQAADLQNLKIQCEENGTIINNLRSDITKSHLGLEKLDEMYNSELCRREEIKDVVKISKELYDEVAKKMEAIERKIKIGFSLVNNIALLNDSPENILAADKALNQQIDNSIQTTRSTLNDLIESRQNMAALEVTSKELHYLMAEKNKLVHFITSIAEENKMLEKDLSVIDESGVELECVRKTSEIVSQEAEEWKLKCDELDNERAFLKNEIDMIIQDIQVKDNCLKIIGNQTAQIDIEISMKEKIVNNMKSEIEKLKINSTEAEVESKSESEIWEEQLKEKIKILSLKEESVQHMTNQYSELKQAIVHYILEEKDILKRSDAVAENVKSLEEKITQLNMKKQNNEFVLNLLGTKVSDAQSLFNSAQEKLNAQSCDYKILATELSILQQNLEQVVNGNSKLCSAIDELQKKGNALQDAKEKISNSIEALELKIQKLKTEDADLATLDDPIRGESLLENLKSGISVWKEGMDSAINDLAEQRIEREFELKNKLKSILELLEDAKMKIISTEVLEDLKRQDAELVKEIQNQEDEKIRLMAELKGTQDKITVTVNSNTNLPLSQSSTTSSKSGMIAKRNLHQEESRAKLSQGQTNRRRRLYNPSTVSSTVALESDNE